MSDDPIIETHDLDEDVWAVFTGCSGEEAHLRALFFDEDDARAYVSAKHPDPEEFGRDLAFDATWTPGRIPPGKLTCANDYRVHTRAEFDAAVPRLQLAGDVEHEPDEIPRHLRCALANAQRAFEQGDIGSLATINETIQPLTDAALAFHYRQSSALRALWQNQRNIIGEVQGALDAREDELARLRGLKATAAAYVLAERARTRNADSAAEERLDAAMTAAWATLVDALGMTEADGG